MARYSILEPAYVGERLVNAGDQVEVPDSTVPGPHMKPLDEAAQRAVKAAGNRMTRRDPVEALTA